MRFGGVEFDMDYFVGFASAGKRNHRIGLQARSDFAYIEAFNLRVS
jgi:hypothetical protein